MARDELRDYSAAYYALMNDRFIARRSSTALKHFNTRTRYFSELSPGRVLDVGCERGFFLESMRRRGWEVEGVEPYEPFAAFARNHLGLEVHAKPLQDVRLPRDYDLVTLWHVLEHVPDPLDALRRCRALLKPGGLLFFEVPNIDSLGPLISSHYWSPFRDPTHQWFFRTGAIQLLAGKAGLTFESAITGGAPGDWYGLKRGLQGRVKGAEHHESLISQSPRKVRWWRRALASTLTFYPFMKLAAWVGGRLGRGEVLRVWCRRPKPDTVLGSLSIRDSQVAP